MISANTFKFLRELKSNNYKEWFDENRAVYTASKKEFENLTEHVIAEISMFDKEAAQTTGKDSIFRINRDIRFSHDKIPYKTNMGAFIAQGGRKSIFAGYYMHIEPGACFLSGGIYMPSGPVLKAVRTEIFENTEEFRSILSAPDFIKHFGGELWGEKLKTAPKGFPKDYKYVDLLKFKHYSVFKNVPDNTYLKPEGLNEIKNVFKAMAPFNAFVNRAIQDV